MAGFGTLESITGVNGDRTSDWVRTDARDERTHVPAAWTIAGTVTGVDILGRVTPQDTPVVIHTVTTSGGIMLAKFPYMAVRTRGGVTAGVRVSIDTPVVAENPTSFGRGQ